MATAKTRYPSTMEPLHHLMRRAASTPGPGYYSPGVPGGSPPHRDSGGRVYFQRHGPAESRFQEYGSIHFHTRPGAGYEYPFTKKELRDLESEREQRQCEALTPSPQKCQASTFGKDERFFSPERYKQTRGYPHLDDTTLRRSGITTPPHSPHSHSQHSRKDLDTTHEVRRGGVGGGGEGWEKRRPEQQQGQQQRYYHHHQQQERQQQRQRQQTANQTPCSPQRRATDTRPPYEPPRQPPTPGGNSTTWIRRTIPYTELPPGIVKFTVAGSSTNDKFPCNNDSVSVTFTSEGSPSQRSPVGNSSQASASAQKAAEISPPPQNRTLQKELEFGIPLPQHWHENGADGRAEQRRSPNQEQPAGHSQEQAGRSSQETSRGIYNESDHLHSQSLNQSQSSHSSSTSSTTSTGSAGGRISSIIYEMESMPDSVAVQRLGCWALGSIASRETIQTVLDLGGLDSVEALLRPSASGRGQPGWKGLRKVARQTVAKLDRLAKLENLR